MTVSYDRIQASTNSQYFFMHVSLAFVYQGAPILSPRSRVAIVFQVKFIDLPQEFALLLVDDCPI
jgi:hypothetical protein